MTAPELVIFDCDGVLIDSEVIAARVDAAYLAEVGFDIGVDEIMQRYVGITVGGMIDDIEARYGRKLPDDFAHNLRLRIAAAFESELQPIPGIESALQAMSGKRCVASSSLPERLRHALSFTRLLRYFDPDIFSASEVARGKPAPDLFLHAAGKMAADPRNCLVIEDSVAGVQAARAAGMSVFGFTGGSHCRDGHDRMLREAGASVIFSDMRHLPELI